MKHPTAIVLTGLLALAAAAAAQPGPGVPDLGTEEQRAAGKVVYDKYCSQCHGDTGDGQGIATPYLNPAPRDFTRGKYKIRTTPNGTLPTDADVARVIRLGIPYTAMPGFPPSVIGEGDLEGLVHYLKTFSPDFEDPEAYGEPITLPAALAYDSERARTEGYQAYQEIGCGQCHGEQGRGDGATAPTLKDDWGHYIRAADLTMPWTFRGGGSREDIFRTLSTGFNGTPMASFAGSLSEEQRWLIADWIVAQAGGHTGEAPYTDQVVAVAVETDLALSGDPATDRELFAEAPEALFPVIGQIMQPGRMFHPSARAVRVRAVYNRDDIALLVSWNDMAAETTGTNRPDLEAPAFLDEAAAGGDGGGAGGGSVWGEAEDDTGSIWGDAEEEDSGSVWGDAEVEEDAGSVWGDAEVEEDGGSGAGSIWGDAEVGEGEGDFWGEEPAAAAAGPASEFSDAVAVQLPWQMPAGVVKPYFLFGDAQNAVELWFADLAEIASRGTARLYRGRGSDDLGEVEGAGPEVTASYEQGEWSVIFKRPRRSGTGIELQQASFVPLAVSVWDGFNRERGNRRGLTRWMWIYLEPSEKPSPFGPMVRAALIVLALELLIVALVRRSRRKEQAAAPAGAPQEAGA